MSANATVNYHIKSSKEQAFKFDVGGVIGNLISPDLAETDVQVRDLRSDIGAVCFDTDGIQFQAHKTQVGDFTSDQTLWCDLYERELEALLKDQIGAKEVIIFDHTVRIDDPHADRKPARNVHNDYSKKGAEQRLVDL